MNKTKNLCFDLDGCLYLKGYETELQKKYEYPILSDFLENYGYEFSSIEELKEWIEVIEEKHNIYAHDIAICKELGISFDEILKNVFYRIPIEKVIPRDKELVELMKELKNKYKLAIFTERQDYSMTERVLKAIGLKPEYFEIISTRKDRLREGFEDPSKRNPEIYEYVFKSVESEEIHYFEDNAYYLKLAETTSQNNGYKINPVLVRDNIKEIIIKRYL